MTDVKDIKYLKVTFAAMSIGRDKGRALHMGRYLQHVYLCLYLPSLEENRPTEKGKEAP